MFSFSKDNTPKSEAFEAIIEEKNRQISDWSQRAEAFARLYSSEVEQNSKLRKQNEENIVVKSLLKRIEALEQRLSSNYSFRKN